MRLSTKNLDLELLKGVPLMVLIESCDEIDEWKQDLAKKLETDEETVESLMDELRIFFALAIVFSRGGLGIPGHEIYQPPPKLERLLRVMWTYPRERDVFCLVTHLPQSLAFQDPYPELHRIDARRAVSLTGLAPLVGLPINAAHWQF